MTAIGSPATRPDPSRERSVIWNVSFVGAVGLSLFLTQFLTDGPWLEVGAALLAPAAVGLGLRRVLAPVLVRRDPWERHLREQAKTGTEAGQVARPVRLVGEST